MIDFYGVLILTFRIIKVDESGYPNNWIRWFTDVYIRVERDWEIFEFKLAIMGKNINILPTRIDVE